MPAASTTGGEHHLGGTMRRDAWWLELVPPILLLSAFGIYATLRAFEGNYYSWGPYLSPFYSPLIDPHHRWWPFSPALLILIWPLGFRATCYYYRKAYYRAFFLDPPRVRSASPRGITTGARLRFHLFCKTSIATFCMRRASSSSFSGVTRSARSSLTDASEWESAPWFCFST